MMDNASRIRRELQDFIWEKGMEPFDWAKPEVLRQPNCGCLVVKSVGYLDLFAWSSGARYCDEHRTHELIVLLHDADDTMDRDDLARIRESFAYYISDWDEEDELLAEFDKIGADL